MPCVRLFNLRLYPMWLAGAMALLPGAVFPQSPDRDYPTKTITLVVPYAPGNTDILARIYLQEISRNTGWTFT